MLSQSLKKNNKKQKLAISKITKVCLETNY